MVSIFFSYSHRDEEYRNELETHLAMLKREGSISAWHDRHIDAGAELHDEIDENLEKANIILLLVSSYFLSSGYCYEREMTRALERQKNGEVTVIPVIVHPCDWKNAPFSHLRATPTDGKPISKFPNLHDAYLSIVTDIRQAIGPVDSARLKKDTALSDLLKPSRTIPSKRSSNLRVKQVFTEQEQDEFLDGSFEFIANFFEGSLDEVKKRSSDIYVRFKRIDVRQFTAAIYRNGGKLASCRVSFSASGGFGSGITYSSSEAGSGMSEILNVENDGHSLLLKAMLGFQGESGHLTQEGAAEHLWSKLIQPLQ